MRVTSRLLAVAKASSRYLEAGSPTGLTGLHTHPSPRSTLIYLYGSTLDKLKKLPESSVYRQSVEGLTKHRLQIVESIKPEGLEAWEQRVQEQMKKHPEVFEGTTKSIHQLLNGQRFVSSQLTREVDEREEEWDGELVEEPHVEGIATESEGFRTSERIGVGKDDGADVTRTIHLEGEPALTAEQISDLETQLGAGLIEEVVQVAEGENKLVDTMTQAKVWEDLVERPVEGQWSYFERSTHMPSKA